MCSMSCDMKASAVRPCSTSCNSDGRGGSPSLLLYLLGRWGKNSIINNREAAFHVCSCTSDSLTEAEHYIYAPRGVPLKIQGSILSKPGEAGRGRY